MCALQALPVVNQQPLVFHMQRPIVDNAPYKGLVDNWKKHVDLFTTPTFSTRTYQPMNLEKSPVKQTKKRPTSHDSNHLPRPKRRGRTKQEFLLLQRERRQALAQASTPAATTSPAVTEIPPSVLSGDDPSALLKFVDQHREGPQGQLASIVEAFVLKHERIDLAKRFIEAFPRIGMKVRLYKKLAVILIPTSPSQSLAILDEHVKVIPSRYHQGFISLANKAPLDFLQKPEFLKRLETFSEKDQQSIKQIILNREKVIKVIEACNTQKLWYRISFGLASLIAFVLGTFGVHQYRAKKQAQNKLKSLIRDPGVAVELNGVNS